MTSKENGYSSHPQLHQFIHLETENIILPAPGYYNHHLSLNTSSLTSFLTRGPDHHHRFEVEVQSAAVACSPGLVVDMVTVDMETVDMVTVDNCEDSMSMDQIL